MEKPTYIFLYSDGGYKTSNKQKHMFSKNFLKKIADNFNNNDINSIFPNISVLSTKWQRLSPLVYTFVTTDIDIALMIELDPESILNTKAKRTVKFVDSLYVTPESYNLVNQLISLKTQFTTKYNILKNIFYYNQEILLAVAKTNRYNVNKSLSVDRIDYSVSKFYTELSKHKLTINEDLITKANEYNEKTFDTVNMIIDNIQEKMEEMSYDFYKESNIIEGKLKEQGFKLI